MRQMNSAKRRLQGSGAAVAARTKLVHRSVRSFQPHLVSRAARAPHAAECSEGNSNVTSTEHCVLSSGAVRNDSGVAHEGCCVRGSVDAVPRRRCRSRGDCRHGTGPAFVKVLNYVRKRCRWGWGSPGRRLPRDPRGGVWRSRGAEGGHAAARVAGAWVSATAAAARARSARS